MRLTAPIVLACFFALPEAAKPATAPNSGASARPAAVRGSTQAPRGYVRVLWKDMGKEDPRPGTVPAPAPHLRPPPPRRIVPPGRRPPASRRPRAALPGPAPSAARPSSMNLLQNFAGLADNNTVIVPDVMGAVGPDHLMITLNTEVLIQNRAGGQVSKQTIAAFWAGVGTSPFDPKLVFDPHIQRFIFTAMDQKVNAASAMLLGVSESADPTGAWYLRSYDADAADNDWADYPNLAVNEKWIAVTGNMLSIAASAFQGSKMWVFDKSAAAQAGAVAPTAFNTGFDDTGSGSASSIHGALTFGSEETLYMVDNNWTGGGKQYARISRITGTAGAPSWSLLPGSPFIQILNFGAVVDPSQSGSAQTIDAGDSRVQNAVFRNGRFWFTFAGGVPAAAPTRDAVFWYQIDPGAREVVQSGVIDDPGGTSYFFPSIAVNGNNDALIGFAGVSASTFLSGYYAGRSGRDALGGLNPVALLKAGEAKYYRDGGTGRNRWGDYTATVVDPVDDLTFWTLQQYAVLPGAQDQWGTWWGKVAVSHDLPSSLDSVKVFPVPWTPGSGDRFDSADVPACGRGLIFEDVGSEADIRIYTALGDLVASLRVSSADDGCAVWDGTNSAGRDAASGVYLAVIRTDDGAKTVKKLVIER